MTFRPSAPHKKRRWLALFATLIVSGGLLATPVFADLQGGFHAIPESAFIEDDLGADDQPNQRDLTAQGSATHDNDFYTGWTWDDTSVSGGNTLDGCSLYTSDADSNADFVVCATLGGSPLVIESVTVYACSDHRKERCTNPEVDTIYSGSDALDFCRIATVDATNIAFGGNDTLIVCNISAVAADTGLTELGSSALTNSCAYPSAEPNSAPTDCVLREPAVQLTAVTAPTATTTWTATLNDRVQITPNTAAGSVVFKLWGQNVSGTCTGLLWTSNSVTLANGFATSVGAGTASGNNVITQATSDADLKFYWTVEYSLTGNVIAPASTCGEETTITPATVSPNLVTFP